MLAYATSKSAMITFTSSLALDLAKNNIRVNAICPAVTKTPMVERFSETDPELVSRWKSLHPIGRFAETDEVASAVLWLFSNQSSYVTGTAIPIDGGWTAQ